MSTMDDKNDEVPDHIKELEKSKPEDTDFRQQRLRAWQPLLTPRWVISTFFIIGCIFIPIGIVLLIASNSVVEIEQRYDVKTCESNGCLTTSVINIKEKMEAPVYFYYKLSNFYQNHRRYVKSRSDTQLAGKSGGTSTCDPLETYGGQTLYPCGLIANSFFNDEFTPRLSRYNATDQTHSAYQLMTGKEFDSSRIAWDSDREEKFKDRYLPTDILPSSLTRVGPRGQLPRIDNEHFIVWMRTAGLPTFRKLYAKIDTTLYPGDRIEIETKNNFPVSTFDGEKSFVLSTTSWAGGKNDFLAWAYLSVGILCIVVGVVFLIKQIVSPRPLGDMKYFNWPGKRSAN